MWHFYVRTHRVGNCNPGVWIHDPATMETIVDTGAIDEHPLAAVHKRTIEAAPDMIEVLQFIVDGYEKGEDIHGPKIAHGIAEARRILEAVAASEAAQEPAAQGEST